MKVLEGLDYYVIVSHIDKFITKSIIITSITEEEEQELDLGHDITLVRSKETFNVKCGNVECYGIIDFNNNSDDFNAISNFNWLEFKDFCGVMIPANYDYEKHCAYSDLKFYRRIDTFKPELVAQYAHGVIGKPERCVIFKHYWKK